MLGKSTNQRLQETIDFVRNRTTLSALHRAKAADFLERYLQQNGAQAAALSNSLHIGDSFPDPSNFRPARRAYVLLHTVLTAQSPFSTEGLPQGQINISGISATASLPAVVKLAAIMNDQQRASNQMAKEALDALLATPLTFLQANKIMINGSSQPRDPLQNYRNVLPYYVSYDFDRHRWLITPSASMGAVGITADSVLAHYWTDIPGSYVANAPAQGNFSQLNGIQLCSRLMVTTQFTGCAFAMKRAGGHVYCAHTAPKRADGVVGTRVLTGTQLAQEIGTFNGVAGDFSNAPGGNPLSIYGAGWSQNILNGASYPSGLGGGQGYMSIVGVLAGGGDYHVYSQITQNANITSAQRIF